MEDAINNISDTAFWIAGYRAQETERPDAVFNDHLAAKLAGQKGRDMVDTTPHTKAMAFAMIVRTTAIDRLVEAAIREGVDTVVNLAAGMDTRPYRMDLPENLQWIEVDLPAVIQYKNEKLKDEKPRCHLERIAVDLANEKERMVFFKNLESRSKKALVISEGLIGYLKPEQAAALSADIYQCAVVQYWIQDYARGKRKNNRQIRKLAKAKLKRAPIQFHVKEPIPFFEEQGWRVKENIYILDEADRIGRKLPMFFPWSILIAVLPGLVRSVGNKTYGYVMFGKN
jgi:methyltransferase (TIGR00027 family)